MKSRASENQRIRKRAWALIAALLTVAECWTIAAQGVAAANPSDPASGSAPEQAGAKRSKIPMPRQFGLDEIQSRSGSSRPARPKIAPPRRFEFPSAPTPPAAESTSARPQAVDAIPVIQPGSDAPATPAVSPSAEQPAAPAAPEVAAPAAPEVAAPAAPEVAAPAAPEVAAPAAAPALDVEAVAPQPTEPTRTVEAAARVEEAPAGQVPAEPTADAAAPAAPEAKAEAPSPEPLTIQLTPLDAPAVEADRPEASVPTPAEIQEPQAPVTTAPEAPAVEPEAGASPMPAEVKQALEALTRTPPSESAPGPEAIPAPGPEASGEVRSIAGPAPADHAAPAAETIEKPAALASLPESVPAPAVPANEAVPPAPAIEAVSASTPPAAPADASSIAPASAASPSVPSQASAPAGSLDDKLEKTACTSCGGFHSSLDGPSLHGCLSCGEGQNCVPGRKPCYPPSNDCNTLFGAFCLNLYESLCCPDPCYQPAWIPAANASFFADYARPRTVTRLRYDNLESMTRPDRNQFWINQVKLTRVNNDPARQRRFVNPEARLQQLYLYQEAAGERGSFFVEYPYRQLNSNWAPTQAGFGDINFGVKSLMFDTEMLQLAFQMRTYMPSGNFSNNLGTGQFVVDPSILASLKLGPDTYFQTQIGNWIPVGGPGKNGDLAGGIFYWFMSLNQVLWYATPDSPLIATLEMDGWSFENGGYTQFIPRGEKAATGPGRRNGIVPDGGGVSYFNIGPGLRQSICNRLDVGGAITWATDSFHWAQPWFRFEVRFLF